MNATIEVTLLEDLDLEDAPPCEFYPGLDRCGKPSVVRVRVKCPCGANGLAFLCEACLEVLKTGGAKCLTCLDLDNELSWGEA